MKLYYFWDAYCGWCYGFESIFEPFLHQHPELEVTMVSGGLFNQGQPIGNYPHMREANAHIHEIYGVQFSQAYEAVLQEGSLVLDSNDAAIGFGVLRSHVSLTQWLQVGKAMQEAFYQQGRSLSNPETYRFLATQLGLDAQKVVQQFQTAQQEGKIHSDIVQTQNWQIPSFPTVIAEVDGQFYDLKGNATSVQSLETNYTRLIEYLHQTKD